MNLRTMISLIFLSLLAVLGVPANRVYPPSKLVKLSIAVSKAAYLPFNTKRYIKNGAMIENKSTMSPRMSLIPPFIFPPKYNPTYDKEACNIKEWTAEDFVYKETEVVKFTSVKQKLVIFGFRGTEPVNILDWIQNFNLIPRLLVIDNQQMGRAHRGFVARYHNIAPWFETEYMNVPQDYNIVITGHSLGGAEATIAALFAAVKLKRRPDAVLTFGSPYPGLKSLSYHYNKTVGCDRTLRMKTKCDLFTKAPFPIQFPFYTHVCAGVEVDGQTGISLISAHNLYVGYDRGINNKYTNVNDINHGCDQVLN